LGERAVSAYRFAVSAATDTRNNLQINFQNPGPAVNRAIQSVFSLWRSSFSALRPVLTATPNGGLYEVRGAVLNKAAEEAQGVELRLSTAGCRVAAGEARQAIGTAMPGIMSTPARWIVEAPDGECRLKMEAAGAYNRTPDLQYAVLEKTLPYLGKATVQIDGPTTMVVGQAVLFIARTTLPAGGTSVVPLAYAWTANGARLDSPYDTQRAKTDTAGPYTVRVEVFREMDGLRVKIGVAERTFQVAAAQTAGQTRRSSRSYQFPKTSMPHHRIPVREREAFGTADRLQPYDYNEGLLTTWYENGNKKEQAFYKKNLIDGDYVSWYENGVMKGRIPTRTV
jgi:hypothetical protein